MFPVYLQSTSVGQDSTTTGQKGIQSELLGFNHHQH